MERRLDLRPGARFADVFEIVGPMGPVIGGQEYAARRDGDDAIGRLTILDPALAPSAADREAFIDEVGLAQGALVGAMVAANACGADEATGAPWAFTPWVEGSPLAKVIRARGPLDHEAVRALLAPLYDAIVEAHGVGLSHAAISPATLHVEPGPGPARLRILRPGVERFAAVRAAEVGLAAPADLAWLAPEVAMATGAVVGPAADVYGLALIAFYLFTARPLFDAVEVAGFGDLVGWFLRPLPRASERFQPTDDDLRSGRGLPPHFDAWLLACTDRDPARRPANATAAWHVLAGRAWTIGASPPGAGEDEWADVPAEGWPAIATAALPVPVAQWAGDDGAVHVKGGGVELVLDPKRSSVRAAGIDWEVYAILPRRALERVLSGIARVALLLRDAPRLGTLDVVERQRAIARLAEVLAKRRVPPPPVRPNPWLPWTFRPDTPPEGVLCASIGDEGLQAMVTQEIWISSHETGVVGVPFATFPLAELPADRETFAAIVDDLRELAPSLTQRPTWTCTFCGLRAGPIGMHSRTACHGCAERHLGIIH